MPLNNCKVETKTEWTRYCVFPAGGSDYTNPNKIILILKNTKLHA